MAKRSTTGFWHTEDGTYYLGETLKYCFKRMYKSLAMSMFVWTEDSGKFDHCFRMSKHKAPEKFLINNSQVAIFPWVDEVHMLPVAQSNLVNIYGEMSSWHVVPVAYADNPFYNGLMDQTFDYENSALILNSFQGTSDVQLINVMVDQMVDDLLSINQRVLMTRAPFVFTVEGSPDADVSAYMNAILNFKPWITTNARGSMMQASISDVNIAMDPSMLDVYSFYESIILSYIGIKSTDIHKRAQQTVAETGMMQDKILGRRKEKLRCRQIACEEYNDLYGTNLQVSCIYDEQENVNGGLDLQPAPGGDLPLGDF